MLSLSLLSPTPATFTISFSLFSFILFFLTPPFFQFDDDVPMLWFSIWDERRGGSDSSFQPTKWKIKVVMWYPATSSPRNYSISHFHWLLAKHKISGRFLEVETFHCLVLVPPVDLYIFIFWLNLLFYTLCQFAAVLVMRKVLIIHCKEMIARRAERERR